MCNQVGLLLKFEMHCIVVYVARIDTVGYFSCEKKIAHLFDLLLLARLYKNDAHPRDPSWPIRMLYLH